MDTLSKVLLAVVALSRAGVRPLVELGALWQGAKQAVRAYRSLRPSAPRGPHEVWEERQSEAVER